MPSRYTMMLWVGRSLARKSSTCGMSTRGVRPSDTTLEKPTAVLARPVEHRGGRARPTAPPARAALVLASGPAALALRLQQKALEAQRIGPQQVHAFARARSCATALPRRRRCHSERTTAALQPMRPAISSARRHVAAPARSARDRHGSGPVLRACPCAHVQSAGCRRNGRQRKASRRAARRVWPPGSSAWPTKATMEAGQAG